MPKHTVKIAIVSHSLGSGGAERTAALLSRMLSSEGYEIHNIIINDRVDYEFGGLLYNLGKEVRSANPLFRKCRKSMLLKKYLDENHISTIIDHRTRTSFLRELIYSVVYGNREKIYVVHSHNLLAYLPQSAFLAKLLYGKSKLIAVSDAIQKKIRSNYRLDANVIHNPAIPFPISAKDYSGPKYLLFFGRLDDDVKNFKLMLEAFAKSGLADEGIKLKIMGDGPDADTIMETAAFHRIENAVQLMPFDENPGFAIQNAMFTILTSRYEGFPMSIIESLAMGTPVISVDCESGPSEIIKNRENGLLVSNHNADELAQSMKIFAHDAELYQICKRNSAQSVAHLSVENIMKQWKQILPQ